MVIQHAQAGVTASIVNAAVQLHRDLGPGLFESTYELLLADDLARRGHQVVRQCTLPITYRGRTIEKAYRIDMLVDHSIVLEIKSSEQHSAMYRRQLLTYLRLTRLEIGLVLNFGLATMKDGIDRVINQVRVP